jgi:Fe-S-cluster containining protein
MKGRELPVLGLPFRRYPTRRDHQSYDDERQVCRDCLSGACCESEDAIYLTSFDVFRLAAFFDVTPSEFLLRFTQERFDDDLREDSRRESIDDYGCSIVTYLRRRDNFPASPCIFLKYVRELDGTPRRICSVHEARPLACREFYFDTCKKRVTGELAALLAEGYEKVRDGEINEARVDAELNRLRDEAEDGATLSDKLDRWFWAEMKRSLSMQRANIEGSNSYDMSKFQDPIDQKLNRVLSSTYVRFEEKYGPKPRDEQLMPYTAGLSFAESPERQRIEDIVRKPPSSELFSFRGEEFGVGVRTLIPGVRHSELFATIPGNEVEKFLTSIPHVLLFPNHDVAEVRGLALRDVYDAVLRGFNHLIRFASYLAEMDGVVEDATPGEFESEFLEMIGGVQTSLNPFIARNPYLDPVANHAAELTLGMLERATAQPPTYKLLRFLSRVRPAVPTLSPELRSRFASLTQRVDAGLRKDGLDLYVSLDNPVELRRRNGKRLNSGGAWEKWSEQALDIRYAADAGFAAMDLDAFFAQSADDLDKIPFRKSYARELCQVVINLSRAMSSHHRIAYPEMAYKEAARRVSAYAVRLAAWIEDVLPELDVGLVTELVSSVYKDLGLGYNHDRRFGLIVRHLVDNQLSDGSWNTDPILDDLPDCQSDYLRAMYRATWLAIDVLRPLKTDVLNTSNAVLGLV